MAKKRFKEGMESLFGETAVREKELSLFPTDDDKATGIADADDERRGGSSKGFASQLDAFLAEAFEAIDVEEAASDAPRGRRSGSGLDLLIRSTTDTSDFTPQAHSTRRVTLTFNKEQLEQLKTIARQEKVYLKDIVNELVEKYLKEYYRKDGRR